MNILILQISALGDIIYTLYNIKKLYYSLDKPNIDWIVKKKNEILENQKEINKVLLLKDNIENKYDIIIDFGTKRETLYTKFNLTGKKFGFKSEKKHYVSWFNDYNANFNSNISVVKNQENLLKFICNLYKNPFKIDYNSKIDYTENITKKIRDYIEINNLKSKKIILINPNASRRTKEIPSDILIDFIINLDKNIYNIILIGEKFGETASHISKSVKDSEGCYILPKYLDNLYSLGYLINYSDVLITPDTSILHLGEFQKKNVIGYYLGKNCNTKFMSWGNLGNKKFQLDDIKNCSQETFLNYIELII